MAGGAALMLAVITGIIEFNPTAAIGAAAAIIGGVVLLGAKSSTSRQTVADMRAAETLRSELIGKSSFGGGRPEQLHRLGERLRRHGWRGPLIGERLMPEALTISARFLLSGTVLHK